VTGGLRYTYEKKVLAQLLQNYSLTARPPAPPGCSAGVFDPRTPTIPLFCRIDIDTTGAAARELTYHSTTYKVGVEYDVAEQSLAYASVSTGFKSGGFSSMPPPNTFKPEKVTAFEAGVKNRFLDNRLQINVEAFYLDYEDHQETSVGPTSVPGFFALQTNNAGQAKSYGADLDVVFRVTPQDELSLKVQYNKTKYDSFTYFNQTTVFGPPTTGCAVSPILPDGTQRVDCAGKPLMRAPLWTGTARYSHDFDLGSYGQVTANFETQFSSSYFLSTDYLPDSGKQESFAIGNFDLTYTTEDEHLQVAAFVHNIWDEVVYTQGFHYPYVNATNPLSHPEGLTFASIRAPRTVGASLRISF
jgi:iron complex outermembrane recepter protein